MRLSRRISGTSPVTMRWARPSTMAVLPTPASPSSTGLFLVRRERIWITRSISFSRPMTGSSLPSRASSVRSRPKASRAGRLATCRRPGRCAPLPRRPAALLVLVVRVGRVGAEELEDLLAHVLELDARGSAAPGRRCPRSRGSGRAAGARCRCSCGRGCSASSRDSSSTFLARGVKGSWPIVTIVGPVLTSFSTSWRIFFRSMSRFLRTVAATPLPSWTRPSRMCSVPM